MTERLIKTFFITLFSTALVFAFGCSDKKRPSSTDEKTKDWLSFGSNDERFSKVSKHLRGFDLAMVEVGYRFSELYWAGQDRNWEFAKYHSEKIRTAIKNGLERRPARTQSAQMIYPSLDALEEAMKMKDGKKFGAAIENLRNTCNACHSAEKVPYIHVQFPLQRLSPIKFSETNAKK